MTIEDKKLAEKILEQNLGFITCCKDKSDSVNNAIVKPIIEAMEQYYHAKLAKITDADIHIVFDKETHWSLANGRNCRSVIKIKL